MGVAVAAGLGAGAVMGWKEIRGLTPSEALASTSPDRLAMVAPPAPIEQRGALEPGASVRPRGSGLFQGVRDELLVAPLRAGEPVRVKFNRGGSSISLRIDFHNGARAAFKPDQVNLQSIPRKEVAAYRVNRVIGLSSVAPAIARELHVDDLIAAVDPESAGFVPRMQAEMVTDEGFVSGELSWWIPVIQPAQIDGYAMDSTDGIVTWKRCLTVGNPIPTHDLALVAQISEMLVFDFLINNADRWSGRNAQASGDGRTLYFMDNTLSFGREPDGHGKVRRYLTRSQKFSRSLIRNVRDLDEARLRDALDGDRGPYEELLTAEEIEAVMHRRDWLLGYVDDLIATHGADEVLVFP